jgi:ubiquitin-like-conjugating enzyme ATG3
MVRLPSHIWILSSLNMFFREAGDASRTRDFLPSDKQYLITRGVPCLRRATSLAYTDEERLLSIGGGKGEDEWVETHTGRAHAGDSSAEPAEIDEIPDVDDHDDISHAMGDMSLKAGKGMEPAEIPDLDEIPDMEEEGLEDEDDAAVAAPKKTTTPNVIDSRLVVRYGSRLVVEPTVLGSEIEPAKGNLLQVRTYDVLITYDKYYQTPRLWLLGYDEVSTHNGFSKYKLELC